MKAKNTLFWTLTILLLSPFLAYGITGVIPGINTFIVTSGSMEPEIQTGALLITLKTPAEKIKIGDTITYQDGEGFITHEVIKKETENNETYFKTKGIANQFPDPGRINENQVAGKKAFSIPFAGTIIKNGLLALILIPATIIITNETINIIKETGNKKK